MKKKLIFTLIAACTAISIVFSSCSLLDLLKGEKSSEDEGANGIECSETYQGKLSESSYETNDEALDA